MIIANKVIHWEAMKLFIESSLFYQDSDGLGPYRSTRTFISKFRYQMVLATNIAYKAFFLYTSFLMDI